MTTESLNSGADSADAAGASYHGNHHTHYQYVGSTLYPETRRRLATLHSDRVQADKDAQIAGFASGLK